MSALPQDRLPHPFLEALASSLAGAGVERSLEAAAAQMRYLREHKETPDGARLSKDEIALVEDAVASLDGGAHGGELVSDEVAGQVVAEAEHKMVVLEGLRRSLTADGVASARAEEALRKILGVEEGDVAPALNETVKWHRHIARVLKRKAKPSPIVLAPLTPTTATDEQQDAAALQNDSSGEVMVGLGALGGAISEAGAAPAQPAARPALPTGGSGFVEQAHPRGRGGKWVGKGAGLTRPGQPAQPDQTVVQLQQRLSQLGFKVNHDGQFGAVTEQAVMAFQTKYGLPPTGKVDEATTEMMRQPPPLTAAQANNLIALSGLTIAARQKLESDLSSIGYDAGASTSDSLRQIQKANRLPVTGAPDGATLNVIREMQTRDKRQAKSQGYVSADQLVHAAIEDEEGVTMPERIEETVGFDPSKHPRGRGGKFSEIAGLIRSAGFHHGDHPLAQAAKRFDEGKPTTEDFAHARKLAMNDVSAVSRGQHGKDTPAAKYVADRAKALNTALDATEHDHVIQSALDDWHSGRAYLDNGGNYRLKDTKKIAPWNTKVKRMFSNDQFHAAAKKKHGLSPSGKPLAEASYSSGGFDTNTPVQQVYGGINGVLPQATRQIQPADPDDRTPGMDDFFGQEPVRLPPNLREAESQTFARCATCAHHDGKRLCALYSAGTDRDDLCDSWYTLSPPEQVNAALLYASLIGQMPGAEEAGGGEPAILSQKIKLARTRLEEAVRSTGGAELAALVHTGSTLEQAVRTLMDQRVEEAEGAEHFEGAYWLNEADFSAEERQKLASKGKAMRGGGYPIRNASDLANAIQAFGRAKNKDAVKAWIVKRAKALGLTDKLPETWGIQESVVQKYGRRTRNVAARGGLGLDEAFLLLSIPGVTVGGELLDEAADSMAKATIHEPVGKPGGPGLWKRKSWQLPAYIQHIANDLREKRGMDESRAIATAIAAVKRWAAGGGKVDAGTRAAAAKAVAEWEALRARAKAGHAAKAGKALAEAGFEEGEEEFRRLVKDLEVLESAYPLSIHFDPRLHPRGRRGEFTDVLGRLMKAGRGAEVTLPHGVAVRRARGGQGLAVSHMGKRLGVYDDPAAAAEHAIRIADAGAQTHDPGLPKLEKGRIVPGSMGSFLTPPGHPDQRFSVETDLRRRPENRGSMSLSSAAKADWLHGDTRREAQRKLDEWQPAPLDHPAVQEWVHKTLGYYHSMYASPGHQGEDRWNVSNLVSDKERDPVLNAHLHAGVNAVRRYYPDFQPKAEDFAPGGYGQKAESMWHADVESLAGLHDKIRNSDLVRMSDRPGVTIHRIKGEGLYRNATHTVRLGGREKVAYSAEQAAGWAREEPLAEEGSWWTTGASRDWRTGQTFFNGKPSEDRPGDVIHHAAGGGTVGLMADPGNGPQARYERGELSPDHPYSRLRAATGRALASGQEPIAERPATGVDRVLGNQVGGEGVMGQIRAGDRVTIRTPQGQERSGRAVMRGQHGWVLNMGGAHGTPGIADERNVVKVAARRKLREVAADVVAKEPALNADPNIVSLLKADEAYIVRLPLAEVLVKYGSRIAPELREELHDRLVEIAPKEESEAKLQEAREQGDRARTRLYETLVTAVS